MSSSSSNSRSSVTNSRRLSTRFEYVNCRCGIAAPIWEAWRKGTLDPGRRFFGCSRFKDPYLTCNFFQWAEPPFTDRAREVIDDLKTRLEAKTEEVEKLIGDMNFNDRKAILLNGELVNARKKIKETEELEKLLLKKEQQIWLLKKSVIASCVVLLLFLFILVFL